MPFIRKYIRKKANELSGGQYQRICLALSLLVKPKLLICDEATTGLDKINELRMIKILKKTTRYVCNFYFSQ